MLFIDSFDEAVLCTVSLRVYPQEHIWLWPELRWYVCALNQCGVVKKKFLIPGKIRWTSRINGGVGKIDFVRRVFEKRHHFII